MTDSSGTEATRRAPAPARGRRTAALAAAAASLLLAVVGMRSVVAAEVEPALPPPVAVSDRGLGAARGPSAGDDVPSPPPPRAAAASSEKRPKWPILAEPMHVVIPAIGVDTALVRLELDQDGRLEVPRNPDHAGWWSGGAAPGAPGPAVIAGHVDSLAGPAAFHRLRELRPGDEVVVVGTEGSVTFQVDAVEQHPKDDFPTESVYGGTDRRTLRLITCGGAFDRDVGHYDDNVIVYATARSGSALRRGPRGARHRPR